MPICRSVWILFQWSLLSVKGMHISIADDTKKRFYAACTIRGLKIIQVKRLLVVKSKVLKPAKLLTVPRTLFGWLLFLAPQSHSALGALSPAILT